AVVSPWVGRYQPNSSGRICLTWVSPERTTIMEGDFRRSLQPWRLRTIRGPLRTRGHCRHRANRLNDGPQAPVAQLDRALPSEGKGHTFESCRARHFGTKLGTPKPAVFALSAATSVRRSALFDPMMRNSF